MSKETIRSYKILITIGRRESNVYKQSNNKKLSFNKGFYIKFQPWKNVIVGKNNSGKSNIIKAINIVLGENSPTYVKSNNITENDFYSSNQENANKMMVFCELKKNDNEEIDINAKIWKNSKKDFKFLIYNNTTNKILKKGLKRYILMRK